MATEPETLIPLVAFSQVEKVSGDCVGGRGLLPGCRQHMGGRRRGGQRGLQSRVRLGCQAHACLFPQVVLLGDHKQLRPVVKNEQLQSLGLDRSLFERYHKEAYMLDTQYRMVSPAQPRPAPAARFQASGHALASHIHTAFSWGHGRRRWELLAPGWRTGDLSLTRVLPCSMRASVRSLPWSSTRTT